MGKKILIAVCNCAPSEQIVKYVANICSSEKDIVYGLFNVRSLLPQTLLEKIETNPKARAEAEALVREESEATNWALERFRHLMVCEGIKARCIQLITKPVELGIAKDILNKAEDGSYDAIVLGRQGLTPSNDTHIGSIAGKVVEHALKIPIWIVAGEATSMGVLLAVDGSQNSLRALDHVLRMVGANPELRLTIFHVPANLKYCEIVLETGRAYDAAMEKSHLQESILDDDNRRMKAFYDKAYERIKAAGLDKSRLGIKSRVWGHDIAMAVIDEAIAGQHGTIVVGRRGERKAFFSGQIAARLLQKVSDQALWVVS